ncbi:MAG: hypothetical protein M1839_009444 [Geoglossum umbratile]|nr:MAG: hypothetical protein M1839_009444 [Geoglossum umbratile]
MPFFMENPRATNPARAKALQTYLLLHSQHDELLRRLQSPSSSTSASPSPSPTPSSAAPPPPTNTLPASRSNTDQDPYALLLTVNNQTKAILTSLLACSSAREDPNFRAWVQSRLMETEQELRDWRRLNTHAEGPRREEQTRGNHGGG